ncbi:magnesium protoporphyrin IX methyltransferase [uncultured Rhodospira sp.]|uniref:magnesium protoporphyrin IX methyltransferase n=1 Tax=uncultured Rhodospira sp. TaxID=1936189 RepID=UPI002639628B|nr:magnesium protoporphyrin IX methyltransferase [uncultured Rhodospira sp.]
MPGATYEQRRGEVETYFDRTAAAAWERLTSDAPVGRIRATVRAGRDTMRATLLGWLPADLSGHTVLDAGCGPGAASLELARRGARVIAIDLSPTLVDLARERLPADLGPGSVEFYVGDMLDPPIGMVDHVVAMDSFIHYRRADIVGALSTLAARTRESVVFTYAPRTALLSTMHVVGRLFPRGDRAPAIEPVAPRVLHRHVKAEPGLSGWRAGRTERVTNGFYISQAQELVRS